MPGRSEDELKQKMRKLKKLEQKMRGGAASAGQALVWDAFFDLKAVPGGKARYTLAMLMGMGPEEYRTVLDEYFFQFYSRLLRQTGAENGGLYDPVLLAELGLPPDADEEAVKRRFRALARQTHPDAGGTAEQFIAAGRPDRNAVGHRHAKVIPQKTNTPVYAGPVHMPRHPRPFPPGRVFSFQVSP